MKNELQAIRLDKLIGHPANPNKMSKVMFNKLVRNIDRSGRYEPLIVRPHPTRQGYYQIINGHHRASALAQLDYDKALSLVWDVDDEQTELLLCTLNRLGGTDVVKKKVQLLRRLRDRLDHKALSKLLPQSRAQLQKLTNLKPPAAPAACDVEQGEPVVFFLKPSQKRTLEKAINAAGCMIEQKPRSRALARALCLVSMAGSFLDFADGKTVQTD